MQRPAREWQWWRVDNRRRMLAACYLARWLNELPARIRRRNKSCTPSTSTGAERRHRMYLQSPCSRSSSGSPSTYQIGRNDKGTNERRKKKTHIKWKWCVRDGVLVEIPQTHGPASVSLSVCVRVGRSFSLFLFINSFRLHFFFSYRMRQCSRTQRSNNNNSIDVQLLGWFVIVLLLTVCLHFVPATRARIRCIV